MLKEKVNMIYGYMVKYSKWLLPIVIIIVVALTVSLALKANDSRQEEAMWASVEDAEILEDAELSDMQMESMPKEVPFEENTVEGLYTLVCTYFNAYAFGDVEAIKDISNHMVETDEITIPKMSEYVDSYSDVTMYTKPGPIENSYLAYVYYKMQVKGFEDQISGMETFYVCTDENGTLYLNEGDVSEEELEYIREVSLQDDVVELYNRVNVEYTETMANNSELHYYITEFVNEVQKATGEELAAQISGTEENASQSNGEQENGVAPATVEEPQTPSSEEGQTTEISGPVFAKATTTVNVRSSDSTQADKIDKVTNGTKVEVLEQKVNGWSRIKVNGKEGYIKSEYLQLITVVSSDDAVGTVTAKENVNVRSAASTSSDRLGVLPGGTSVDLLSTEGEWSKINYNGQIGYVKSEFLQ